MLGGAEGGVALDAVAEAEPASREPFGVGPRPDADEHGVSREGAAVGEAYARRTAAIGDDALDEGIGHGPYTVFVVHLRQHAPDVVADRVGERHRPVGHQRDLAAGLPGDGGGLGADEASADDHQMRAAGERLAQGCRVVQRAQDMNPAMPSVPGSTLGRTPVAMTSAS